MIKINRQECTDLTELNIVSKWLPLGCVVTTIDNNDMLIVRVAPDVAKLINISTGNRYSDNELSISINLSLDGEVSRAEVEKIIKIKQILY